MKYIKLFENLKTHKQIEHLSELILSALANKTLKEKYWEYRNYEHNPITLIESILPVVLSKIDNKNQGFDREFKKFIKDKRAWLRIMCDEMDSKTEGKYDSDRIKFDKNNNINIEIYLYFDMNDVENYFETINKDLNNMTYHNLYKFLLLRKEALIHELQHAYDDWSSDGNAIKLKNISKRDDKEDSYIKYVKSPHEISAHFTHIASRILEYGYKYQPDGYYGITYNNDTWKGAAEIFKKEFPRWEKQKPSVKKRLITRFYELWYDRYGKKDKQSKDITENVKKLVNEMRNDYGKEIYIYYHTDLNAIIIHTMKVETIENEKVIYKKLIRLADIYRKTIAVSLYKGYTTNAIGKAKEYLKEYGFIKNTKPKRDYKFREDYIRYSKRK